MKRTLAIILVISMLVCMLPAFSLGITAAEDDEVKLGLNADFYAIPGIRNHDGAYKGIIGTNSGDGHRDNYDDTQLYDESIEQLLKISKVDNESPSEDLNVFPPYKDGGLSVPNWDGYMIQWKGTVTAKADGTYYLAGHKVDNGFVMFVKQGDTMKKVYEYWAAFHWFDAAGCTVRTNLGGFELKANEPTEVEIWYMESTGGQGLDISVATSEEGELTALHSADSPLTFNVTGDCWRTNINADHDPAHNIIKDILGAGVTADGQPATDHNDCQASMDGNHLFNDSYEAIKATMVKIGSTVTPNFETDSIKVAHKFGAYGWGDLDDMLAEFSGYFTVGEGKGGAYQFGTRNVDNCLMVEVEIDGTWTRVYEFWAKNIWNDRSDTYYQTNGQDVTVNLEEGKTYGIRAYFLEINGGNPIETIVKINGERQKFVDVVTFTTTKPTAPVKPSNINIFDGSKEWYYKTSGEKNEFQIRDDAWKTDPAVYGTWEKAADPASKWGTGDDPVNNQSLWAVTTFEIEDIEAIDGYELMVRLSYDDNIRMYVNGQFVYREFGWNEGGHVTWGLCENAKDILVQGTNTIAFKLVQGWGGAGVFVDALWLTLDENGNNPYEFKYTDKDGVKQSGVITTADQWLAYVADANARGDENKHDRILIAADLDFTGKTWVPLNKYIGQIYGEYHTFKNITYTATADATAAGDGVPVGLLVNNLANNNANGHIENLTLENCTFTVEATNGANKEQGVLAGLVAGMVDRGRLENVTVKNSKLLGNAYAAGGIAGVACWNYDQKGVHVENCAVIGTEVNATNLVGGIVGFARGGDRVLIGNAYIKDSKLNAPQTDLACAGTWGWGENVYVYSTTVEGNNTIGKTLAADGNYKFYYQTRDGADGTKDYRIICVANKAWATSQSEIKVSISFFNESLEKSTVATANTVYTTIKADGAGLTEIYGTDAESVIFGWVVTGVPAEFLNEEPAVDVVS